MIDDFARAARVGGGVAPICDARSGLLVQATIDAAFESAETKRHVAIDV